MPCNVVGYPSTPQGRGARSDPIPISTPLSFREHSGAGMRFALPQGGRLTLRLCHGQDMVGAMVAADIRERVLGLLERVKETSVEEMIALTERERAHLERVNQLIQVEQEDKQ